jgi:ketosteroid isomerase-like protein
MTLHSRRIRHDWLLFFDAPRASGLPSGTVMQRPILRASRSRKIAPALAVLLFLAACPGGWALPRHENKAVHREIESLEQQWRQAILTNNVAQMNNLLSDDYVGITSNGTVETKAQALAQRRAGTVSITKLDLSDVHIRAYGDTAVVTSVADLVGSNGDSDISGKYRYTRVYARRRGAWKIVSFEASRVNDIDRRAKLKHKLTGAG